MTTVEAILRHPLVQVAGWALIHFVWQGCLIALLLFCVRAFSVRQTAQQRYRTACLALLLMAATPPATISLLQNSQTFDASRAAFPETLKGNAAPVSWTLTPSPDMLSPSWLEILSEQISNWLPWLMAAWLVGVLVLSLRLAGGVFCAGRLRKRSTVAVSVEWHKRLLGLCERLRVRQTVGLLESGCVHVPTVIGWLHPVILLPASTLTGLTTVQLEAILAHELAHIRRQDYLVNLLQNGIEILLFYHPAVWWVSRQVRTEREHCCDDLAVAAQGDALSYARALAELETLRASGPQLALAANGGPLVERIERLLGRSQAQPASWLAVAIVAASLVGVVAVTQGDVFSGQAKAVFFEEPEQPSLSPKTHVVEAQIVALPTAPLAADASQPEIRSIRAAASNVTTIAVKPDPVPKQELMASSYTRLQSPEKRDDKQGKSAEGSSSQAKSESDKGDYISELGRLGYTNLSVDDLIQLKSHGVSPEFVEGLKEQGLTNLSVEQLVKLRSNGIQPAFIRDLKASGYTNLGFEQLLKLRMHGLSPQFVTEMAALGFARLPLEALVSARQHGVGPEFVKGLQSAGYAQLPMGDLIKARMHGVSPEFIKSLQSAGYTQLSMDDLIKARMHGVSSDFVRDLQSAGLKNLSLEDLIKARQHGVSADFAKTFGPLGYGNLSLEELIKLRNHGVSGEFVQGIRQEGYEATIDELIRLRNHGVGVDFIRRMKSQGFQKLTLDQLIKLKMSGF